MLTFIPIRFETTQQDLKPVHTDDYSPDFGDNLSPKTATVAEKCDCRRCLAVLKKSHQPEKQRQQQDEQRYQISS